MEDIVDVSGTSDTQPISGLLQHRSLFQKAWPYAVIAVICLLAGFYGCELNRQLYLKQSPFYDSLSYNDKLYKVMKIANADGLGEALHWSCFVQSTNCLPYMLASFLGPFMEPTRMIGVWIQSALLFGFLTSLFYYLERIRGLPKGLSLFGILGFLTTKCLFLHNGGLSDFRMDLSLYLTYATTACWFLSAIERPRYRYFFLLGFFASIACLFRATAPVYLILGMFPILVIEMIRSRFIKQVLIGTCFSILIVILSTGWFYFYNFEYLKYYYVVWNTDANAKIPLADAMQHFGLVHRSLGSAATLLMLLWSVTNLVIAIQQKTWVSWIKDSIREKDWDWRIAWIGLAPVLFLVLRRAGLNGLVSMPAVFGFLLFFLLPILLQANRMPNSFVQRYLAVGLATCLTVATVRGWQRHTEIDNRSFEVHTSLIETIILDSQNTGSHQANFGVLHLSDLNTDTLFSTLAFDIEADHRELYAVTVDGVRMSPIPTFMLPAKADWDGVEGETNQQKIANLLDHCNRLMDYLIVPDASSAAHLSETLSFNYINRFVGLIRGNIVSDPQWARIATGIRTGQNEVVDIYKRLR
ncbi:MAG: hypothetical protein AAF939_10960 [Planctomycetota bacterium]